MLWSRTLTFQFPEAACTISLSRDERGEGGFRTVPQVKKSATLPPHSGSALPPHSKPWTPAAYDVPMALEEEEEELESEEELDHDVEHVCAGGDASGSRLASGIAGGWPRKTGPRQAILSGSPRLGALSVQVHGLVDSVRVGVLLVAALGAAYEFMALWTVYEMACFFMFPCGNVPVNMRLKLQQSVRMTVVCLAFSSSTELDIAVMPQ